MSRNDNRAQSNLAPLGMKGTAAGQRRPSVDAVLDQFRNGNRDS